MFTSKTHVHFIGIGGIGVSAMAYWALHAGKTVSGSDRVKTALTEDLTRKGAMVQIDAQNHDLPDGVEVVVYTEAIDQKTNGEYLAAVKKNLPTLSYFEALGELSKDYRAIAVAGTHGKTTTTAMMSLAAIAAGLNPTVFVGSKVRAFDGTNFRHGESDLLMVEACEYRESFLHLNLYGLVLLNCEAEHLDYYGTEARYLEAYRKLVARVRQDGFVVANRSDANVCAALNGYSGRIIWVTPEEQTKLDLKVLGEFNQWNAHMALNALEALGAPRDKALDGLTAFNGTWRRLEHKGTFNGALLIDDYGHHPTEIKATLKAIKERYADKKVVCVFQGHQYSRTHQLLNDFVTAFKDADRLYITELYEVRDSEEDKQKIDGKRFAEAISKHHPDVKFSGNLDETYDTLAHSVNEGDVLVVMGAGTIGDLAERLIEG